MEAENPGGEKKWIGYLAGMAGLSSSEMRQETLAFSTRIRQLGIKCLKCGRVHEFAKILSPCANCSSTEYRAENITGPMTINCNRCAAMILDAVKCECGCVTPLNYRQLLKEAPAARAGMCFVATAACGDPFAPEVMVLSAFRDDVLSASGIGRAFIRLYYSVSPPVAAVIASSGALRRAAMVLIVKPAVRLVRLQLKGEKD